MAQGPFIRPAALIEFLEALYRWDASDEEWLRGLCDPLLRVVPSGIWVQAMVYDVSTYRFECPTMVMHRAPKSIHEIFRRYSAHFTPAMIARSFRATSVSTLRSQPELQERGSMEELPGLERETGAADVLVINGLDPSGRSANLNVGIPRARRLTGDSFEVLRRMSGHLASAARVRRRIAAGAVGVPDPTADADAVFSPTDGGRLVHARPAATGRDLLTRAMRAREATRSARQRDDALESWRPLVDARWTLVDSYEVNGGRYIVARENRADAPSLEALSVRERQVVACLAYGQTTKEIAYSLGIDASTVRVLLTRAVTKLGVDGRRALLDHPVVRAMRGGIDAGELARIRASERDEP